MRQFADLLIKAFFTFAERMEFIPTWEEALDRTYSPNSREWKLFQGALHSISEFLKNKGHHTPLFFVLNSALKDNQTAGEYIEVKSHKIFDWYARAMAEAERQGFIVLDVRDAIATLDKDESLVVNSYDAHPSAALNRIYARELSRFIKTVLEEANR